MNSTHSEGAWGGINVAQRPLVSSPLLGIDFQGPTTPSKGRGFDMTPLPLFPVTSRGFSWGELSISETCTCGRAGIL